MDASIPAPTWSTRFDLFLWTRLYTYYIQWDISCHVFAGLLFHLDTIKFVILLFLFDVYWMYITFSDLGSPQLNRPSYLRCLCAVCFCYDHSQKWGKRHNSLFCWVCELKMILYCEGWIVTLSIVIRWSAMTLFHWSQTLGAPLAFLLASPSLLSGTLSRICIKFLWGPFSNKSKHFQLILLPWKLSWQSRAGEIGFVMIIMIINAPFE